MYFIAFEQKLEITKETCDCENIVADALYFNWSLSQAKILRGCRFLVIFKLSESTCIFWHHKQTLRSHRDLLAKVHKITWVRQSVIVYSSTQDNSALTRCELSGSRGLLLSFWIRHCKSKVSGEFVTPRSLIKKVNQSFLSTSAESWMRKKFTQECSQNYAQGKPF